MMKEGRYLKSRTPSKKTLIVNPDLCIGCRMCEAVCSLVHYGAIGISHARLKVVRYDKLAFFNPVVCMQCEAPYCGAVCPSQAVSRDSKTGVVTVSKSKCTGCKMCLSACPFGAMTFVDNVAIKCDHCGGKPSCVEFCQAKALTYGSPNDISDTKRISISDKSLEVYKDALSFQRK
jgi:anaerobic carbon-monoxide dehydrogenase iron sulfur subunit